MPHVFCLPWRITQLYTYNETDAPLRSGASCCSWGRTVRAWEHPRHGRQEQAKRSTSLATALFADFTALVLIVGIIYLGKAVLFPLALAVLLTFILTPPVTAFSGAGLAASGGVFSGRHHAGVASRGRMGRRRSGEPGWPPICQPITIEIQAKIAHLRGTANGRISRLLDTFRISPAPKPEETAEKPPAEQQETGHQTKEKEYVLVRQEQPTSFETMSGDRLGRA